MRQLSNEDILNMIDENFIKDNKVSKDIYIKLNEYTNEEESKRKIKNIVDFHEKTEEQVYKEILNLLENKIKKATIITGKSGILKPKFLNWAKTGKLSENIKKIKQINIGSYEVEFKYFD